MLEVRGVRVSETSEVKGKEILKLLSGVPWISTVFLSRAAECFTTPGWRVG